MDRPPYKWVSSDVANNYEEATFDVSTILVDTGWMVGSAPVLVNNPKEYCCKRSEGKSNESGKGFCVGVWREGKG